MDWDYIFSLTPEDLNEDEKDDLYNTVTWFNSDGEELTLKKSVVLLKLNQEILKYKGEQVEILLSKLDELATQQGEDEGRKTQESDTDARSSKSRKSSSLEFENLEQKYLDIRSKYKKLTKTNEKLNIELVNRKSKISILEQENRRLISEMQMINQDDNQSDVSETIRDQHKELIQTVQNKNKQISELLQDIEETEKDNTILREKLTTARDELSTATKELNLLTESYKNSQIQLTESLKVIKKLETEKEYLQDEAREVLDQKLKFEQEMEEFSEQVNVRVDEWKRILEEKQQEIDELKSKQPLQSSIHSSISSLPQEKQQSHISTLHKILSDREKQVIELKTKLQESVAEMEAATEVIKNLSKEKDDYKKKMEDLAVSTKDLKKKLKSAHERSRELQDSLSYAEKSAENSNSDLKEIIEKLKSGENCELGEILDQNQQLKSQNRIQEKEIIGLVKTSNKLQELYDQYDRENQVLRDKLGISDDEQVNTSGFTPKQKQQNKRLALMVKQIETLEEEKLDLKTQIHKLTKNIAFLNDQLSEPEKNRRIVNVQVEKSEDKSSRDEIKALVEENEALRRGMHEILNELNARKSDSSLSEMKSDTFEKLLRALDAKHISGWYHPAMRLQAELHNQEGINAELREQLRLVRLEANKNTEDEGDVSKFLTTMKKENFSVDKLQDFIENLMMKIDGEFDTSARIEEKLIEYKSGLTQIGQQMRILFEQHLIETQSLNNEQSELTTQLRKVEETNEIYSEKLKLIEENLSTDEVKRKLLQLVENEVILKRKCYYYENEMKVQTDRIDALENDLNEARKACTVKINDLKRKNESLSSKIKGFTNQLETNVVTTENHQKLQLELDSMTLKYRKLLQDYERISKFKDSELEILQQSQRILESDKTELKTKIGVLSEKLHNYSPQPDENGTKIAELSKKLSQSEINVIGERQRANHTNGLYELVKEQLKKSEENCSQYEKQIKDVLDKNLELQERLKVIETNLFDHILPATYKSLESKYNELLIESDELRKLVSSCEEKLGTHQDNTEICNRWNIAKAQKLLELKHQIVDLQADSDDKMQIARLNSELSRIKTQLEESNITVEDLTKRLQISQEECAKFGKKLEQACGEIVAKDLDYRRKLSVLRDVLDNQRLQYLGCVPLISQEKFVDNLKSAILDKHDAFVNLYDSQTLSNESATLKEQYDVELKQLETGFKSNESQKKMLEILVAFRDTRQLRFNEIKYRRQYELKQSQLQHIFERVKIQDEQIMKLEEELFSLHQSYNISFDIEPEISQKQSEINDLSQVKLMETRDIQTDEVIDGENSKDDKISSLRSELINLGNDLTAKEHIIQQLKSKITEHEMNMSLFRKQLGDKQSQITFYERHILELQNKKDVSDDDSTSGGNNDETLALKCSIKSLQESIKQKDEDILKYQNLLKDDRDKHSMAASLMRDELKILQRCLSEENKKTTEFKHENHPSKAALEQYFVQVHSLEEELAQFRTKISSLESQLQASRDESVRWRILANDRLESMQKLGSDLEQVHRVEMDAHKKDSEKWREEVNNLKLVIGKYRKEMSLDSEFQRLIKDKDDKIHELTLMMRHARNEVSKISEKPSDSGYNSQSRISLLESTNEQLVKEYESLKKRFEQVIGRERNAREEIRNLRGKLLKKPILSARSDRSDKSIKDQLQKKVSSLENEIVELKDKLMKQQTINESHRIKISEDFDRWNKQKHWQQTAEKLKEKLKGKEVDFDKLQQTCAGYRILIERMEREKYNLESKVRSLKCSNMQTGNNEVELLRLENMKLISEHETLLCKLEMQQHHAGALGAAMLQDKLEAQERKIAVLELASKGPVEVRAELERLQNSISGMQKVNLRLEADNLDLKLDFEKSMKDVPHLREQIQHLESYIEVLKNENLSKDGREISNDPRVYSKKISELERTIFVLKRVVEKLRAENKQLFSGGKRAFPESFFSADKLKQDHHRLKEQYREALRKIARFEQDSYVSGSDQNIPVNEKFSTLSDELTQVKEQLSQKSQLLNKVKVLLHRAAAKEKELLRQIAELKEVEGHESEKTSGSQSETS